jgi:NAD(P)-dependent dehydrogenase (short-subunit alcohol dehydrogenase family)
VSWSPADIPDQTGRTALVTGVSVGGLGHYTALELARSGARVVLAGRNPDKLAETDASIREELRDAALERLVVDLADLSSVRSAAGEAAAFGSIDLLVNNAGIMATPYRRTVDGFESQLATNHFGPFLLTGLLLPHLASGGRVVTVSSLMHRFAHTAPLGDPQAKAKPYLRWVAYSQTKLANLLFIFELDRRLRECGRSVSAHAAHPGYAGTHLVANGRFGRSAGGVASILDAANRAIGQSPVVGAWPTLMAATADVPGSTYCGPSGLGEVAGSPRLVGWTRQAGDRKSQRALWELSEKATGITYP